MTISILDLFSIGIGPSSSHTLGPMRAANDFLSKLIENQCFDIASRIQVALYGSLALTGIGHGTDKAVLMGLIGHDPETIDTSAIPHQMENIKASKQLSLMSKKSIHFDPDTDLLFHISQTLPKHANGMRFLAFDHNDHVLFKEDYYSIGGGFIVTADEYRKNVNTTDVPFPITSAEELLTNCHQHDFSISELMMKNEQVWRDEATIKLELLKIADVMQTSIDHGVKTTGTLPGGLNVKRRASALFEKVNHIDPQKLGHAELTNWLSACAMAVNEENAAGHRIVTAPTNGAAGIIPAVLAYYKTFYQGTDEGVIEFLLTAGAIGLLYKKNASLSAAEVGCQGETGVASSMAAGALVAVLGGTIEQVEKGAEIAMEHSLGLTCDPVAGLVQIPCIERNAIAASKALSAAFLALNEDQEGKVSLDSVILTMFQTGKDMKHIYKETSLGGLAVNVPAC